MVAYCYRVFSNWECVFTLLMFQGFYIYFTLCISQAIIPGIKYTSFKINKYLHKGDKEKTHIISKISNFISAGSKVGICNCHTLFKGWNIALICSDLKREFLQKTCMVSDCQCEHLPLNMHNFPPFPVYCTFQLLVCKWATHLLRHSNKIWNGLGWPDLLHNS